MFPFNLRIDGFYAPFYEGFYFLIAVFAGLIIGNHAFKRQGIDEEKYSKILLPAFIGAIIGGRLFHILFWGGNYYLQNPEEIFALWKGGISITGALAGALVAALAACKLTQEPFPIYLSLISPTLLISQGIGRIGCLLNGDAYGIPTKLPWGIQFKRYGIDLFSFKLDGSVSSPAWSYCYDNRLVDFNSDKTIPLHPTQIYEAIFDFIFAFLLSRMIKNKRNGTIICYTYMAGYSLFRFFVEYIRGDREEIVIFNTSLMQIVLLFVFIVFIVMSVVKRKELKKSSYPMTLF